MAPKQDQAMYLDRIEIHKMNRQTFDLFKTNVILLDSNIQNENNLKNRISATFPIQEERLQREQKKFFLTNLVSNIKNNKTKKITLIIFRNFLF